jgi:hypothetical protein
MRKGRATNRAGRLSKSQGLPRIIAVLPLVFGFLAILAPGLRVVAIESVAPVGQAGTTSMIENYLGFPQGVSGNELATRAVAQARRFGAEVLLARPLVDITEDDPG